MSALGYLGWSDLRRESRAVLRGRVIDAVCLVMSIACGVYGILTGVTP